VNKNINNILLLLNNLTIKFSVIAITETWIDNEYNQNIPQIPGYDCYSKPRTGKRGGGIALYIKDNIKIADCPYDDIEHPTFESLFIKLSESKHCIGVIYRPPDTNMNEFTVEYEQLLSKLSATKKKLTITGDFNINLLNFETHLPTENFLNNLYAHFLYPTITKPTRITPSTTTLIDNIFVNNITDNHISGIIIADISDHLPVFLITGEHEGKNKDQMYSHSRYRDVNDDSIVKFAGAVENMQWQEALDPHSDVNDTYDLFIDLFTTLYDKFFPVKTKTIKIKETGHKPWITSGIIKSIRRKNNLYKVWIKKRSEETLHKYKSYKNKLTGIIRAAEKSFYRDKFQQAKDDIRLQNVQINNFISLCRSGRCQHSKSQCCSMDYRAGQTYSMMSAVQIIRHTINRTNIGWFIKLSR
jgi:hypothetical protein